MADESASQKRLVFDANLGRLLEGWIVQNTEFTGESPFVGNDGLILALENLKAKADAFDRVLGADVVSEVLTYALTDLLGASLDSTEVKKVREINSKPIDQALEKVWKLCPVCDTEGLELDRVHDGERAWTYRGLVLPVSRTEHMQCKTCDEGIVTREQSERNDPRFALVRLLAQRITTILLTDAEPHPDEDKEWGPAHHVTVKEAIDFYANPSNYQQDETNDGNGYVPSRIDKDEGRIARSLLNNLRGIY